MTRQDTRQHTTRPRNQHESNMQHRKTARSSTGQKGTTEHAPASKQTNKQASKQGNKQTNTHAQQFKQCVLRQGLTAVPGECGTAEPPNGCVSPMCGGAALNKLPSGATWSLHDPLKKEPTDLGNGLKSGETPNHLRGV